LKIRHITFVQKFDMMEALISKNTLEKKKKQMKEQ